MQQGSSNTPGATLGLGGQKHGLRTMLATPGYDVVPPGAAGLERNSDSFGVPVELEALEPVRPG